MKVESGNNNGLSSNLSEINVTPLVDVMLVLLIIFMVTAPMMDSGINVTLPSAESKSNPSSGGLVLTISKDQYIYLQSDKTPINIYLLESRLKNYFAAYKNDKKKIVFLKADKDVSYGYVVSVMDIVKKSGVETVGMLVDKNKK